MLKAFIATILVSILSAIIGSHTLYRKGTFFSVSIAHISFAGATMALFLTLECKINISPYVGAIILGLLLVLPISLSKRSLEEVYEIMIGAVFAISMSLAVLFFSLLREYSVEAWGLIVGDILLLTNEDMISLCIMVIIAISMIILVNRELIYTAFDPEGAESLGISPRKYNVIFSILLVLATVVLIKTIGVFLVYVIMLLPPLIAKEITHNIKKQIILSFFITFVSLNLGLLFALFIDVAPSAIAGIILALIYSGAYVYHTKRTT